MALKVGELFATLEIDDKSFSKGLASAQSQTKVLSSAIEASEKKIAQYQAQLGKAQSALKGAHQAQAELNRHLEAAKSVQAGLQEEVARLNEAYKAQVAMTGENSDAANELGLRLMDAQKALDKSSKEVQQLTKQSKSGDKQIKTLGKTIDGIAQNLDNAEQGLSGFRTQLDATNTLLTSTAARMNAAGAAMQTYANNVKSATEWQGKLGNAMTLGITTPVFGAFTYALKGAISFENEFAGVEKTVDGTEEQLADLERKIVSMSYTLPVTAEGLAEIAESAGQLGIQLDIIDEFTETMAKLKSATNLGDEGATILARFANITGMQQTGKNFERLGSVIVELGNTSATTESEIANMAMRIAGAGTQVGMTESEILGVAAALSSLGLQAEAGGSAISRLLSDIQLAVETDSESLKQFADVAGMTADAFAQAFREDAAGVLAAFVEGLGKGTDSATKLLDEMGITEIVITDTLKRASNANDLFSDSIDRASREWDENNALAKEAEKRNQTLASRLTMTKNRIGAAARSLGNTLTPVIEAATEKIGEAAEWFASLDEASVKNVASWAALTAAIGPSLKILKTANNAASAVIGTIGKLAQSVAGVSSLGSALSSLAGTIGKLLGPAGIAALAVGAGYAAYKFVDWASGAKAAREATEALNETAREWQEINATTVYDTGTADPLARFGLSQEAFSSSAAEAQSWLDELLKVWTDGEVETNAQVEQFASAFASASDGIREKIESRGNLLDGLGVMDESARAQMQADLAQLEAWDAEIKALLEKRQGGYLTEEEQARLNEVIQLRAELELSYTNGDGSGYDQIITGMEAEIARLQASGEIDMTVYGDALNALAQGRAAYNAALDESYNAQYAEISAIEDETTRTAALAALNEQYNQQRLEGEQAYQKAVQEAALGTVNANQTDFEGQIQQVQAIAAELGNLENLDPVKLEELTAGLDEGTLTSLLTLIEQLKASGMTNDEIFAETGIDAANLLSTIQQIRDAASEVEGLEGLSTIFGSALPQEIVDLMVGLDMTQAETDWTAFLEGKDPFETSGTVNITMTPLDQAAVDAWEQANSGVELEGPAVKVGLKLGDNWQSDLKTAYDNGMLAVYGENGLPLEVTPEVLEQLDTSDIVLGVDENGVYHVQVVADLGSEEGLHLSGEIMDEKDGVWWQKLLNSDFSATDKVKAINTVLAEYAERVKNFNELRASGDESPAMVNWDLFEEANNIELIKTTLNDLDDADIDAISLRISNLMAALSSGTLDEETSASAIAELQNLLTLVSAADQYLGTGNNVSSGIAQGMTDYGWESDATTLAASIQTAIDNALQAHSPAQKMVPSGTNAAAGIAKGMTDYDFSIASSEVIKKIIASMSSMTASFRTTGLNFSLGLASGIRAGKYSVINAAKEVAKAGSNAANNTLEVSSPSRVTEETGRFFALGFAQGIEQNDSAVAKSAANMARMAAEMTAISNPGRGVYARNNQTVTMRQQPLDYDKLAEAMARVQLNMNYRGRTFAQISAEDTARAQNRRAQGIALGYGKR